MSIAYLPAHELGERAAPLLIRELKGKTYIECDRADILMYHLSGRQQHHKILENVSARGIFTPGETCLIELFDRFGRTSNEEIVFKANDVQERLFNALLWKVEAL